MLDNHSHEALTGALPLPESEDIGPRTVTGGSGDGRKLLLQEPVVPSPRVG